MIRTPAYVARPFNFACPIVLTRRGVTLVDLCFTKRSIVIFSTQARVTQCVVNARGVVLTGVINTIVNVLLTVLPREPGGARTREIVDGIVACCIVETGFC